MTKKRIIFAVGGTGGHFYPALALAQSIRRRDPSISLLFAGGGVKNQAFFDQSQEEYRLISSSSLSLRNPVTLSKNLWLIAKGVKESLALFRDQKPDLVIGFGSYYSLPLLMACRLKKIPYVLHEQNTIPGRVVRYFSGGALFTGIHFPEAQGRLRGKCLPVGMPLREDFLASHVTKEEARKAFGLDPNKPVVLIFGGSQGARGINQLIMEGLENVSYQILHFTGDTSFTEKLQTLHTRLGIQSYVKDFETRMDLAYRAADCMVSRAGAASIAEQIALAVPGVLIPYPYAMDNHQEVNANHFINEVKGGVKFPEKRGSGKELFETLNQLMQNLDHYKNQINLYKTKTKQEDFSSKILEVIAS